MPAFKDLSGQRFTRLVAQWPAGKRGRQVMWLCLCDCGQLKVIRGGELRNKTIKSCGCLRRELAPDRSIKHGHAKHGQHTRTYDTWWGMKQRCLYPNHDRYSNYGGRGITVCDRWLTFQNFLEDMGERPIGMTIDRIENDSNYEKQNCRWATSKEQQANRRNSRKTELPLAA